MKKNLSIACAVVAPLLFNQSANAAFDYFKSQSEDGFKRYSVSGGWLHAMPQGDVTPIEIDTVIKDGKYFVNAFNSEADVKGIENWTAQGTGLEAETVDTAGLLMTYYVDEHWGVEVKAGFPPKVDIMGKGEVFADLEEPVVTSLQIADMTQGDGVAASARAWLPAALVQYQFGKPGINKLRPYVGVGVMYAYFTDLELNSGIGKDLQIAAGRLQLIEQGEALSALGSKQDVLKDPVAQVRDMKVTVEAENAWAPILNVGATYDIDENWFAVGSLSYVKLDSDATISVSNKEGKQLVEAKSNIEIDPYITYLGVGYRF